MSAFQYQLKGKEARRWLFENNMKIAAYYDENLHRYYDIRWNKSEYTFQRHIPIPSERYDNIEWESFNLDDDEYIILNKKP